MYKKYNAQQRQKKDKSAHDRSCIIYSTYVWQVVLKCVAFIGVPYIYLILSGIIHDSLVKAGAITLAQQEAIVLFVFFSLMTFWLVGLVLSVCTVVTFVRKKRRPARAQKSDAKAEAQDKA